MIDYVITFFTHYDAILCSRTLKNVDILSKLAPVPRVLSSSCGTCLMFSTEKDLLSLIGNEYEQAFYLSSGKYQLLRDNRS